MGKAAIVHNLCPATRRRGATWRTTRSPGPLHQLERSNPHRASRADAVAGGGGGGEAIRRHSPGRRQECRRCRSICLRRRISIRTRSSGRTSGTSDAIRRVRSRISGPRAESATNPPASASWGDCNIDYPREKILSPYPYKTAKEHYEALMARAKAAGGPTVYTKATVPDWDGWYGRDGSYSRFAVDMGNHQPGSHDSFLAHSGISKADGSDELSRGRDQFAAMERLASVIRKDSCAGGRRPRRAGISSSR